ncbi:hypothetical protein U9M48_007513 [Paspalum notatum var. saurae]|uniref:Cytochrome P450 n=1 Tax=Paspalum notatum var. saurae TaxID=547442 RepID=A0AAQ3SL68_PASNO
MERTHWYGGGGLVAVLQLAALLAPRLVALWRLAWWPRAVVRAFARQGIRGPSYTFLAGSAPEAKRLVMDARRRVAALDAGCHDIMPLLLPQFHRWAADYGKLLTTSSSNFFLPGPFCLSSSLSNIKANKILRSLCSILSFFVCQNPPSGRLRLHRRTFLFWIGPIPAIFSSDLELIKEVLTDRTGLFAKDFMIPILKVLLGNGLIVANGDDWKRHRKVVLPAFNHERIQVDRIQDYTLASSRIGMSAVTAEATERMTQRWCDQIQRSGSRQAAEIEVDRAIVDLTTEIIGRVAFGTSHDEASEVILLMHQMMEMGAAAMLEVDSPVLWFLPTRRNRTVRRLDKLLRTKIMATMEARVAAKKKDDANSSGDRYGDDLLGLMLEAWSPERQDGRLTSKEVIDECKTFFAAGQETTATLIVWAMFLLSTHPHWQEKVREEVLLHEFQGRNHGGGGVPSTYILYKLKLLHMVLLETLRLYPPVVYIQRKATSDVVLRGIKVPQGTEISIPIGMLQRDKEVWGSDADEFNPMRFKDGDPNALLSFSLGPRACIGQSFAIIEAQVVMAMILSKFSLSLSPTYVHKPNSMVGVQLAAALLALLLVALWRLAWRPRAVARAFARQGIRGPRYTFLAGSLPEAKRLVMDGRRGVPPLDAGCHDIMPVLLPQFHRWAAHYGRTFLFWMGPIPAIFSSDLELIKEVLTDRTGVFAKDFMIPTLKVLLGDGLLLANGDDWKRHRKVVLPAFNHERIKSMAAVAAEATERMTQRWCHQIGARQAAEIEADRAIADLTTEIIGHVAFGTSHEEAGEVIHLMEQMQKMGTAATLEVSADPAQPNGATFGETIEDQDHGDYGGTGSRQEEGRRQQLRRRWRR